MMTYIPELKGKVAEEFIRKADKAKKGSIDWSKQMEDCKKILAKRDSDNSAYVETKHVVCR
jgi:hypothetical protein